MYLNKPLASSGLQRPVNEWSTAGRQAIFSVPRTARDRTTAKENSGAGRRDSSSVAAAHAAQSPRARAAETARKVCDTARGGTGDGGQRRTTTSAVAGMPVREFRSWLTYAFSAGNVARAVGGELTCGRAALG